MAVYFFWLFAMCFVFPLMAMMPRENVRPMSVGRLPSGQYFSQGRPQQPVVVNHHSFMPQRRGSQVYQGQLFQQGQLPQQAPFSQRTYVQHQPHQHQPIESGRRPPMPVKSQPYLAKIPEIGSGSQERQTYQGVSVQPVQDTDALKNARRARLAQALGWLEEATTAVRNALDPVLEVGESDLVKFKEPSRQVLSDILVMMKSLKTSKEAVQAMDELVKNSQ